MMKIITVTGIEIKSTAEHDSIQVYFYNVQPGKGYITFSVFGEAWSAYFGGMGNQTIEQFVNGVSVEYLVGKLSRENNTIKVHKLQIARLTKLVTVIKNHLI